LRFFSGNNSNFNTNVTEGQLHQPYPSREYQHIITITTISNLPQYPLVAEPRPRYADDVSGVPTPNTTSIRPSTPPPLIESTINVPESGWASTESGIYSYTYCGYTRKLES